MTELDETKIQPNRMPRPLADFVVIFCGEICSLMGSKSYFPETIYNNNEHTEVLIEQIRNITITSSSSLTSWGIVCITLVSALCAFVALFLFFVFLSTKFRRRKMERSETMESILSGVSPPHYFSTDNDMRIS
ncbi:hypothetical protein Tcan_15377 [Toxocara canis]|uniref:Uncharacterized protein n=1 Tax=Toxocara canis TaxID=6265 RepID=A0A0B2UXK7_TOXCA|nr:hypothetical protein Tcan_15377 [Toxocara canis]